MKRKVIVLHVKHGYEDRERHISGMLGRLGIEFEWMLDGDIPDLRREDTERWFAPSFIAGHSKAELSCSMKHLLACRRIIDEGLPGALILEDDAILKRGFEATFDKAIEEAELHGRDNGIISMEDTRLRFVEHSRREKGRLLYEGDRDRLAGCYYISRRGAEIVLSEAERRKLDRPIDNFHCLLLKEGLLPYWWCQPAVATQGSFTGKFPSGLTQRYPGWLTPLVWGFKLSYKKLLYRLR